MRDWSPTALHCREPPQAPFERPTPEFTLTTPDGRVIATDTSSGSTTPRPVSNPGYRIRRKDMVTRAIARLLQKACTWLMMRLPGMAGTARAIDAMILEHHRVRSTLFCLELS